MSGDFLQNLITRHLGLEPTLQPRPTSRFETANSTRDAAGVEENQEATPEPQIPQTASALPDGPNREPHFGMFSSEYVDKGHQARVNSPLIVSDSELTKIKPRDPDIQQDLNNSQKSTTPHQEQNIDSLDVRAHKSEVLSGELLSAPFNEDDHKRDGNQFDISERAELFGREQRIDVMGESSNKDVANTSVVPQITSSDIVSPIKPDDSDQNIDYQGLVEVVKQLREEISSEKETAISETRYEQDLIVPPTSVDAEKPLYTPTVNNTFTNDPNIPERETKPEPVINVTIGRVEVRAVHQTDSPETKKQKPVGVMSLDDYLRKRGEGNS